jgi:hypothetical protein
VCLRVCARACVCVCLSDSCFPTTSYSITPIWFDFLMHTSLTHTKTLTHTHTCPSAWPLPRLCVVPKGEDLIQHPDTLGLVRPRVCVGSSRESLSFSRISVLSEGGWGQHDEESGPVPWVQEEPSRSRCAFACMSLLYYVV